MKVRLQIIKNGSPLYSEKHDIAGADQFGKACAEAWWKIRQRQLDKETSVGALMEHLEDNVADLLNGAQIRLERV